MELDIPHNYFTVWMVTPSRALGGARPVDYLKGNPVPCCARWNPTAGVKAPGRHEDATS
jgi:hypothetical protein